MDADEREEVDPVRMRRRQSIREEIGKRSLLITRRDVIDAQLAAFDKQLAEAADEHSRTCGPLQAELTRLEDAAVARVRDRKPADPKNDARRTELITLVSAANDVLQKRSKEIKEAKQLAKLQRDKITMQIAQLPKETALCHADVANPGLRLELFVNQQRTTYAGARLDAAQKQLANTHVASNDHEWRRQRWEAELRAASSELAAAKVEADHILRRMIEE